MKALVTGGNGFIGSFLVEKLIAEKFKVRCLVRNTSNLRWIEKLNVDFFYGELNDPTSLIDVVQDIDIVFHLGGVTRGFREQDYIDGNVTTTQNLLDACRAQGPDHLKFVYVSSQAAGGPSINGQPLTEDVAYHPISMYGRSKYLAEQAVWQFSNTHPATVVRPPSVYGPRDTDFYTLFKNAQFGFLPVVGGGRQKISIIHVTDLVDGIFRAGIKPESNDELFFLSSDEDVHFSQLAEIILQVMGKKPRVLNIPFATVRFLVAAAAMGASLTQRPSILNNDKYVEMKQAAWLCSNAKAKKILGFQPRITIIDGMRETANWYKKQGWLSR